MVSFIKKLLTVSFALYIPFIVWALQTHATQDQASQKSQKVNNDELVSLSSDNEIEGDFISTEPIPNEESTKTPEDHTLEENDKKLTITNEDQENAAEMGISADTYKSLSDLLKETAGIDLGNKPEETLSGDISEGQIDDTEIDRRSLDDICPDSPKGVESSCIPCESDPRTTFLHTDENGFQCECDICRKPTFMKTPCSCSRDKVKIEPTRPTCDFPEPGKDFMPHRNWCPMPFTCRITCPGDMIIVKNCTVVADAECGCPDDTDQTGETSCRPIPTCDVGYESSKDVDGDKIEYSLHICKPCPEGYIQPKTNTWDKCYPAPPPPPSSNDGLISPNSITDELGTGTSESTDLTEEKIVPDTSDDANYCICPSPSTRAPANPTPGIKSGTTKRLLDPGSLAAMWIFTLIIVFMFGIGMSSMVKRKLQQWCDSCHGRSHQASANEHYDNNNKDVAVNMEPGPSVVTYSPKSGQTGTKLSKRGRRK